MNKIVCKVVVTTIIVMLFSFSAMAQKFTTHAVKKGETLESIAKQYKVTPYNILNFNKEVKQGTELESNTILVIPLDAPKTKEVLNAVTKPTSTVETTESTIVKQEKPIGFTTHKVNRKETLYGIAKRYHIKEVDIKRYNKELYAASQLKKGMKIKIPKFKREKPEENVINETGLETYTVKAKETRWSIAHKYGITIDELLELNPSLSKTDNYLAEGQELRLPRKLGSSIKQQDIQLFTSYTVPPKMTFYSLNKQLGVNEEQLVALNPEIKERGGLKEGMVLRIPDKKAETEIINTENYVFYEVKPKQTEFSLTRKLGVSYKELLDLNPDLKNGLKAGMVLKLPKENVGNLEINNALIIDKINLLDSINIDYKPKLVFILPFRLDKVDLNDKENAAKLADSRTDMKLSLGLYSGALVALDSIASLGISVDVKTYDNQLSLEKTKELLSNERLNDVSAVIGPLDTKSLKEVAESANRYRVPVIAPISTSSELSLNNVFYSYTSEKALRERMLAYVKGQATNQNIIVIADAKNKEAKDAILSKFPNAKIVALKEEKKNIAINLGKFTGLLSREEENWIFLETDNFKLISSASSILNSNNTKYTKVRMFTTNKNKAFEDDVISNSHLSNLNFTYPSVYKEATNSSFVKRYKDKFGNAPDKYAARGFDITYDLLLKLAYKNDLLEASNDIGETEYTGNKFNYVGNFSSGYHNKASYIMSYSDMRIKQID